MNNPLEYRIAIIDDHPLFREGMIHLLETEEGYHVTIQADSAQSALDQLKRKSVDLVILDLSLKDSSGLELLKDLRILHPELPVLIITMHDAEFYAGRVRAAGGCGFVMKQEDPDLIITAIKTVLKGQSYFPEGTTPARMDPVNALSDREFSIFDMISQGLGSKEIAEQLNLSVKTVESHKEHLKNKLGRTSAADLLKFAIEWRRSSN